MAIKLKGPFGKICYVAIGLLGQTLGYLYVLYDGEKIVARPSENNDDSIAKICLRLFGVLTHFIVILFVLIQDYFLLETQPYYSTS